MTENGGRTSLIRQVSVLSTGSVDIHPEHVADTHRPLYWWWTTSRRWTGPRPINVYVVERADGLVLFDTGQDRASVTDPAYFPGGVLGWMYGRLARFEIGAADTLTTQLAALGHDIADVHTAVISHLHQDHVGGLPERSAVRRHGARRGEAEGPAGQHRAGQRAAPAVPGPGRPRRTRPHGRRTPGRTRG